MSDEKLPISSEVTISELVHAYVDNVIFGGKTIENPIFESVAGLNDGRWVRIKFSCEHEFLEGMPEEVKRQISSQDIEDYLEKE